MVWGLCPADPLSGEDKYFIFAKGTYKVGRKGCDVIVNRDKGVSRVHAEIIVDAMTFANRLQKKCGDVSSGVRLKDCSKYGTFINKNLESKQKVHECPNRETSLKEDDLICFGTGTATYRFCYVSLLFYCTSYAPVDQRIEDNVKSIGAHITRSLSQDCTHVLVSQNIELTNDTIDAIVAKKTFVKDSWVQYLAERRIRTEMPDCCSYVPALMIEGSSVNVADPGTRDKCLEGYTFVLDSTKTYKFGDRFKSLLEVGGAKICSIEVFFANSKELEHRANARTVFVIPHILPDKSEHYNKVNSLSRIKEMDLLCAVLSGKLEPSRLMSLPVVISSSCSTDGTIVADSDPDEETATSVSVKVVTFAGAASKNESKEAILVKDPETYEIKDPEVYEIKESNLFKDVYESKEPILITDPNVYKSKEALIEGTHVDEKSEGYNAAILDSQGANYRHTNGRMNGKKDEVNESETGYSDILYSQDLIVKNGNLRTTVTCTDVHEVLNFKRFRKTHTESGNSFNNLIPFSKLPYSDSDYGSEIVSESVKEEKKRKQMEAAADDLFNNNKGKRRGTSGSLRLQINDIEPFCQDEIVLYRQCAERRDKELRQRLEDSERKLGLSMPLDNAKQRAAQLESEITSLDRRFILASGVEGLEGFRQRWSLHGRLSDTKRRLEALNQGMNARKKDEPVSGETNKGKRWFFW